jgi:Ran GTPase-activating protein (RanGAP) involved in mRNA processing and transport
VEEILRGRVRAKRFSSTFFIIDECHRTRKLHLAHMKIADGDIEPILAAVKRLQPNVAVINLDNNLLSDTGAYILRDTLHDFHALQELSLQFNSIGKDGATAIFALKKELPKLEILFHGNQITNVGKMAEIEQAVLRPAPKF